MVFSSLEWENKGLEMNGRRVSNLINDKIQDVKIESETIEIVKKFKFLETVISFEKEEQESTARISSTWKVYWCYKPFFCDKNFAIIYKTRLMDICVLPVFTYGAACWTFDDHSVHRLAVEQCAMERIILNVNRRHRIRNQTIRKKTKIKNVSETEYDNG